MTDHLTHVLLSKAPVEAVAATVGEAVPVGRFGDWTVAAMSLALTQWPMPAADRISKGTGQLVLGFMDIDDAVGVTASTDGDAMPLMWSLGWTPPRTKMGERISFARWRGAANVVAEKAGRPEIRKELGNLRNPGDGRRETIEGMLSSAIELLGLPADLRGTHADSTDLLTDVVIADGGPH